MLFTERSIWTMVHGVGLGGAAMLALAAALFAMYLLRPGRVYADDDYDPARPLAALVGFNALAIWLTTLVGTYIVFPPYRAAPPEGSLDLTRYPKALIQSDPSTAWLHAFAMESKEHLPFVAAMLATAVAFVAWRYRRRLLDDLALRRMGMVFLGTCFVIVSWVSLLGVFINKVAPVE